MKSITTNYSSQLTTMFFHFTRVTKNSQQKVPLVAKNKFEHCNRPCRSLSKDGRKHPQFSVFYYFINKSKLFVFLYNL